MSKKIVIPLNNDLTYPEDVKRIVRILAEKEIECTEMDANFLWCEYSDGMAAGWMTLPDSDEDVYRCIGLNVLRYTQEV